MQPLQGPSGPGELLPPMLGKSPANGPKAPPTPTPAQASQFRCTFESYVGLIHNAIAAWICRTQRAPMHVRVAIPPLLCSRPVDERIGAQEPPDRRVVHPPVHVHQHHVVELLVAGVAAPRRVRDGLPLGLTGRALPVAPAPPASRVKLGRDRTVPAAFAPHPRCRGDRSQGTASPSSRPCGGSPAPPPTGSAGGASSACAPPW